MAEITLATIGEGARSLYSAYVDTMKTHDRKISDIETAETELALGALADITRRLSEGKEGPTLSDLQTLDAMKFLDRAKSEVQSEKQFGDRVFKTAGAAFHRRNAEELRQTGLMEAWADGFEFDTGVEADQGVLSFTKSRANAIAEAAGLDPENLDKMQRRSIVGVITTAFSVERGTAITPA